MGRRLLKSLGYDLCFLRKGVTAAVLRNDRTLSEVREELTFYIINGERDKQRL